ncbi:MAG: hypothetical protein BroJett030_06760 [Alphaproteobacteria bacterium]|nr:MAG: hypothetical protein BroJett030_06760 [Alphaproteobacteria bacterium]
MRHLPLAMILVGLAVPAHAQQAAEGLTCEQAVAQFARSGVIYKTVHGSLLPMRAGVPVAQADSVRCGGRGRVLRRNTVKTVDNPRCVYSVSCE